VFKLKSNKHLIALALSIGFLLAVSVINASSGDYGEYLDFMRLEEQKNRTFVYPAVD
jgi:hypothetical protein